MENAIWGIAIIAIYVVLGRYILAKGKREKELMKKHNVYKSYVRPNNKFLANGDYVLAKDGQRVYFAKDDKGEYVVKHSINGVVFKEKAEFCGTDANKVYHRNNCEWAKKIAEKNIIRFDTREEAETYGYRACKVCIDNRNSRGSF